MLLGGLATLRAAQRIQGYLSHALSGLRVIHREGRVYFTVSSGIDSPLLLVFLQYSILTEPLFIELARLMTALHYYPAIRYDLRKNRVGLVLGSERTAVHA